MKKIKRIGTVFYINMVILWIIPIVIYGFYYTTFVKIDESELQEKKMANVGTIISSEVDYKNNYYIDEKFIKGVALGNAYSITIINEFGEGVYSTNEIFSDAMYTSSEVLEILGGKLRNYKIVADKVMTIYIPIVYERKPVGVVMISKNIENAILSNVKKETNLITFLLVITLLLITSLLTFFFTKPINKFKDSVAQVANGHFDEIVTDNNYYEIYLIKDYINKMLHKLKVIEESRQQFVADVSHELKTPLSSMKVLADSLLMQEDAPKEMYREFMTDISEEVDRESKIINDLLTMVSFDNKETVLNYELVSINDLVEQVLRILLPIANERDITLEINSFRNVEAYIDETKLYLVIMNLIENAIKYNKDGGKVTISIDASYRDFTLKVVDTGIGIPADQQDKIFERFYRIDKMRSRHTGGTGLGLSIVNKVIIMHNGSIQCHSEEGVGTTFIVTLPLSRW